MLRQLTVRNFAIISELTFTPQPGLNVFTGETGAGKSVAIAALSFVLGARGSVSLIKDGSNLLEVQATFDNNLPAIYQQKYQLTQPTFRISRSLDRNRKGKASLNQKPVSVAALAEIGKYLVDFHGQHEHQSLLHTEVQLSLLDTYAKLLPLRAKMQTAYNAWQEAQACLQAASLSEQEKQRQLDLCSFQLQEIEKIAPKLGEDLELEQKLPQLKHAGKLVEYAAQAYRDLYEDENAAVTLLGRAARQVREMAALDEQVASLAETLTQAETLTADAAAELSAYQETLQADPQILDQLLTRHEKIKRLKLKYGPELTDVLQTATDLKAQIDRLQNAHVIQEELTQNVQKARQAVNELCEQLHTKRCVAAQKLAHTLQKEISSLGFQDLTIEIAVEMDLENPTHTGADQVEFLFSANAGQAPRPLQAIASGGELSRIMLGLKTILAGDIPVMVFDEIDTGIGGETATLIGRKLRAVAQHRQVLCVTHLASVAACADAHFRIEKTVKNHQTLVSLTHLQGKQIETEIARMLGNFSQQNQTALAHAQKMLAEAKK